MNIAHSMFFMMIFGVKFSLGLCFISICLTYGVISEDISEDELESYTPKQIKKAEAFFDVLSIILRKVFENVVSPIVNNLNKNPQSFPSPIESIFSMIPLIQSIASSPNLEKFLESFKKGMKPVFELIRKIAVKNKKLVEGDKDLKLIIDHFSRILNDIFLKNELNWNINDLEGLGKYFVKNEKGNLKDEL